MKGKATVVDIEFIKSLMKVKNLTESEFADMIGVSHSMVNRILNGKRGAGTKVVFGILNAFPEVTYSQVIRSDNTLTKVNKTKKSA